MPDAEERQNEESRELLERIIPEDSLDYFVARRSGKKRNYIFDYKKSKTCDHPELRLIARGGIVYRCLKCNYAFHIVGGYQQPLHNEVIQSAFNLLVFAKEFGGDSLGEVLRRPIGQHDRSPHKPVLPEGMSFKDVLDMLDEVDVNVEDGGVAQVYKLLEEKWIGPKEKALEEKRLAKLKTKEERKQLNAVRRKPTLSLVSQSGDQTTPQGDTGESRDSGVEVPKMPDSIH